MSSGGTTKQMIKWEDCPHLYELMALSKRVQDMEDYYRDIMATSCRDDEVHCTCVPALRARVQELEGLECIPTQDAYDRACSALHKNKFDRDRYRNALGRIAGFKSNCPVCQQLVGIATEALEGVEHVVP